MRWSERVSPAAATLEMMRRPLGEAVEYPHSSVDTRAVVASTKVDSVPGKRLGWTKDWFAAYLNEDPQKRNLLKHCEQCMQEIKQETLQLELPNPLRTAVCCDILEQVCLTLGPHKKLVSDLKDEMILSIYGSEALDCADKDLMNRVPFFSALEAMRKKVLGLTDRNAAL